MVDEDGICWLTFDTPNSPANVWNSDTLDELDTHIEELHRDPDVRALILRSAKDKIFIAGADLKGLLSLPPEELKELLVLGQDVFNHLETLRIPKIAAIHGACLGGGFEMTLACDWRIASDSDATRLGLPETQLGLIPAWGGCTRLSRLIGLPRALDLILRGKAVKPIDAKRYGMIHHITAREHLDDLARRLALHTHHHPKHHHFHATQIFPVPQILRWKTRYALDGKLGGHYQAPFSAVEVITRGAVKSFEGSLHLEQEAMAKLVGSPVTHRLIETFFRKESASKKLPDAFAKVPSRKIKSAAVVGAGVMGSGITQWLASRGLNVLMCDTKPEFIAKGLGRARKLVTDAVKSHALTSKEGRETLDRISTAYENVPLNRFDMVIESAVEDMAIKKQIFAGLSQRVSDSTILATNTSALSITELAQVTPHPERVVGFHFFNPVHRMPLVEVIQCAQTSPEVIATALRFAQSLGKTPILVKDSPGFLVNRILMPYLLEAVTLATSLDDPWMIDDAMVEEGMPMGPLRLLDEVGLDVAQHVVGTLAKSFPNRIGSSALIDKMIGAELLGKKAGKGFYIYESSHAKPNPELMTLMQRPSEEVSATPTRAAVAQRLFHQMEHEAQLCLDEGVAASREDIELAMILGAGFPPFRHLFPDPA